MVYFLVFKVAIFGFDTLVLYKCIGMSSLPCRIRVLLTEICSICDKLLLWNVMVGGFPSGTAPFDGLIGAYTVL